MSKARDMADPTTPSRQAGDGREDGAVGHQASRTLDDGAQGPCDNPGLYACQDLILSGLYRMLGNLIGDGAKIILIVEDGDYLEVVRNHDDPWSVFDRLACSDDEEEEPLPGPGSRGRLLN